VRQISGETLLQGLLGGLLGALVGIAAVAGINAAGWTLKASAAGSGSTSPTGPGGLPFGFGRLANQGTSAGSQLVKITTSVDPALLAAAIGLAVLVGLLAGAVGGLRAARLSPATALRNIE
jgi:ABC-type antimicrobial peptide transport system permease subunit